MALVQISQAQGRIPVTVFQLQDRVNLGNYQELEEIARDSVEKGTRDLVLDLSKTPSLTSIGIRALIAIYKLLTVDGMAHFKLAGASEPMYEMLKIAGITQFINMYDSVEKAVESF